MSFLLLLAFCAAVVAVLTVAELWLLRGVLPGALHPPFKIPPEVRMPLSWVVAVLLLGVIVVQENTLEQRIELARHAAMGRRGIQTADADFGVALMGSAVIALVSFAVAGFIYMFKPVRTATIRALVITLAVVNSLTGLPLTGMLWLVMHVPDHW